MSSEKINELEEILFNAKDREIIDGTGVTQTVKKFNFNIVRRFNEDDIIIKFKDLNEAIEVLNILVAPHRKEETTNKIIRESKEHRIPANGEINVKIMLV